VVKATCHERGGAAQLHAEGSRGKAIHAMTISLGSGFGGGIIPGCIKHTHVLMAGGRPFNTLMSNNAQYHQQYQFTKATCPLTCGLPLALASQLNINHQSPGPKNPNATTPTTKTTSSPP
jgi:hypothetical protein